jgi:glycosyltransferase involved in cell wall biosynthesis
MRIVTNFPRFPSEWQASNGRCGTAHSSRTLREFLHNRGDAETVFVVDCNPGLVMKLAALFLLLPFWRRTLVAVDLVLRRPTTRRQRIVHPLKRLLLSRADFYINYFVDVRGLTEVYGIAPQRSIFVPFKPNLAEPGHLDKPGTTGEYVLCFGRSLRDFDTFFAAVERLPWPAAVPRPDAALLAQHGSRFTRSLDALPANVRLLEDDGSERSQAAMLRGAKLVVLPILKSSIVASGISTCLNAMRFGKCVIGSAGPGMSDVFKHEVLTVPPEDADALAVTIDRAWRDDELRQQVAAAGASYARKIGGTDDLIQRIIDAIAQILPAGTPR